MLNIDTIDREIIDLEKKDTTYAVVERLAWLYVVRDHMNNTSNSPKFVGESEFMQSIANKPMQGVLDVISDLMDSLKMVQPRVYESVLRKINSLDQTH